MIPSLYSAVSGLEANQTSMDTIGNNIANINTVGFKSTSTQFESLINQNIAGASAPTGLIGGTDPRQLGLGVGVVGTSTNFGEGTSEATGQPLDVSVQGNGFLVTRSGGQTYYTRAGNLQLDGNGSLVEPTGAFVQGWQAAAGVVNTNGPLTNLTIPTTGATIPGTVTTSVTLTGNVSLTSGAGPIVPITVYDATGGATTLSLQFVQNQTTGAWSVEGSNGATGTNGALSYGTGVPLTFNSDGTSSQTTVSVTDNGGRTFSLNVTGLSANALTASVSASSQNGSAPGTLQSYNIGNDGQISGIFSNGQTQTIGQIALASFANDSGLAAVGNTAYAASPNSGLPQVGVPGTGQLGSLSPGTLEMSNVDLGQQFTDLIVAQRGFEANGKVITTSDQLLQDLINLKN